MDSHNLVLGLLLLVIVGFVSRTSISSQSTRQPCGEIAREPPRLPSSVPLLGHLLWFLRDTRSFLQRATAQYGRNTPVCFQLLNRRMTLVSGAEQIATLFRSSRHLSNERWLIQILVNSFGLAPEDGEFYATDTTGLASQPDPRSTMTNPAHRIFHLIYKSSQQGLSGAGLTEMVQQLVKHLSEQLQTRAESLSLSTDAWTHVPDLYGGLVRNMIFEAAVTAMCGSHILTVSPTLTQDFWTFDRHLPSLMRETPRWLAPGAYRARDRVKEHIQRWHDFARSHYDIAAAADDKREWEPYFGSRLIRTRHDFFRKMPVKSIAADDLGLIWAENANSVPAIGWFLLEVLQRPALLSRVRQAIAPHVRRDLSDPVRWTVDISRLCSDPLLQSIYAEVLRIHSGTVIFRVPTFEKFIIDQWHLRAQQPVIISTYDAARDDSVFNVGSPENPHSLDEFWSDRFIVYPGDPYSGPLRPSVEGLSTTTTTTESDAEPRPAQRPLWSTVTEPTFTLDGTAGAWIPYGGGSHLCPGRHFAKQEVIVSSALILSAYDIELMARAGGSFVKPDLTYFMFGTMPPEGIIPARIRLRTESS